MFLFDRKKKIVVIGDVMIDEYYIGDIKRQSPEAPVPVVTLKDRHRALGGAANVANNLKALGYDPYLIGIVGEYDCNGFYDMMGRAGLDASGIIKHPDYMTTTKVRVMGNGQHICRIDRETVQPISDEIADSIKLPDDISVIIFSDYAKGMCTSHLVSRIIHDYRCFKIADPKDDFMKYSGVDVIKPNKSEALKYVGNGIKSDPIKSAANKILYTVHPCYVIITLGEEGCLFMEEVNKPEIIPGYKVEAKDMAGAGDTFTAVLAACLSSGVDIRKSAKAANFGASLTVTQLGVSTVHSADIVREIRVWEL
jgi:rfaE bifunctional protein kinase chain/domain